MEQAELIIASVTLLLTFSGLVAVASYLGRKRKMILLKIEQIKENKIDSESISTVVEKSSRKNTSSLNIDSKKDVTILIEKMNYSGQLADQLKQLGNEQINVTVSSQLSEDILEMVQSESNSSEISQFDLLAFPYFLIGDLVSKQLILPLEHVFDSMVQLSKILKRFGAIERTLKIGEKSYGIPLTNISSILAYRKDSFPNSGIDTIWNIIEACDGNLANDKKKIRFGMVDNPSAFSHYYEFQNVLGAFGIDYFAFNYEDGLSGHNFDNEKFKTALRIYLTLFQESTKLHSWPEAVTKLTLENEIDACFLWTEEISYITDKDGYEFIPIPIDKGNDGWYYQHDGWCLCLANKSYDISKKRVIRELLSSIGSTRFQKEILDLMSSTPFMNNDWEIIEGLPLVPAGIENFETKKVLQGKKVKAKLSIQDVLQYAKVKPNFPNMPEFMKGFSFLVHNAYVGTPMLKNKEYDKARDYIVEESKKLYETLFKIH